MRQGIGDATRACHIKEGEDGIDAKFQSDEGECELLPAHFDGDMIRIAEVIAGGAAFDELNAARANAHRGLAVPAFPSLPFVLLQALDLHSRGLRRVARLIPGRFETHSPPARPFLAPPRRGSCFRESVPPST